MKKIAFLMALCFSLLTFAGCSYGGGKAPDASQSSSAAPTAEEEYQAITQILYEQIRLYEYGCYGTEYTRGEDNGYLAGFAAMHCQTNQMEYGGENSRQSLTRLVTKDYFDVTVEGHYLGDVDLDGKKLTIQPTETSIDGDTATVVIQRSLNGEELLDDRYTFRKVAMPPSFAGTIFEQLAYDGSIWRIEQVKAIKDPAAPEVVEIGSAEELIRFCNDVNARKPEAVGGNFVLTADIDLAGSSDFMPIGAYREEERYDPAALYLKAPMGFNGTFDGGGHTVSGFQFDEYTKTLGFFRVLNDHAVVKNLNLQGSVVNRYTEDQNCGTGGLAGYISAYAHVENCSFSGDVEGKSYVGGFAGQINYLNNNVPFDKEGFWDSGSGLIVIKDCTTDVHLTAAYYAGGFAGSVWGNLDGCTANGAVIISKNYGGIPMVIGGFCGDAGVQLSGCHCNVKVTHFVDGANRMGNFVGELGGKDIVNCTIKADVVNPDWFMVGMKDYLSAKVDIQIVD